MLETLQMAGPLGSTGITPLRRYYSPLRDPLAVGRLPGVAGYTTYPASADFSTGRGGLLQLLSVSLSPCRRFHPAGGSDRLRQSAISPAAFARFLGARPPGTEFRGHISVHLHYGLVTRRRPFNDVVDGLQRPGFPGALPSKLRGSVFFPGRTISC